MSDRNDLIFIPFSVVLLMSLGDTLWLLPTAGTVAGTYFWTAHYSGDGNNNPANAPAEQTVVSAASPGLSRTASSGGLPGSTLTDIAHLSGGYFPTGTITFMLTDPGGSTVDTETVTVNGNGNYTTPAGFTGTVAGTYFWHVLYSGDGNNNTVTANLENVTVGVPTADLRVTITDGVTSVVPGTVDTYTITVST